MLCIMKESGDIVRNSSGVLAGDFPASVNVNAGTDFWLRSPAHYVCGNQTLSLQFGDANVYYIHTGIASMFYKLSLQLKRVDSTTYKWLLRVYGDYFYEVWGGPPGATNNCMFDWTAEKSGPSPAGTYNQTSVSSWVYPGYPYYNVGYPSSVTVS